MKNDELEELLKYINSRSILVVNHHNKLIEIYCPFKVLVLVNIGTLIKGQFEFVEEVKITFEIKTVFLIKNKAYYYYHFDIIVE